MYSNLTGTVFLAIFAFVFTFSPARADEAGTETLTSVSSQLQSAFGRGWPDLHRDILQHEFTDAPGDHPEDRLQSGDVLVYLDTPAETASEGPGVPPMPEAYHAALEGFSHAAIVARNPDQTLFHLDSPQQDQCDNEFRGVRSYIVLRPRPGRLQNSALFEKQVDELAMKFKEIGYDYNSGFKTHILSWNAARRAKFLTQIMNWNDASSKQPPKIPDLYCSELPVTIDALLGMNPQKLVTGDQLLEAGLNAELRAGKTPEQIARTVPAQIIANFRSDYDDAHTSLLSSLADAKVRRAPAATLLSLQHDLAADESMIQKMNLSERILERVIRAKLNLPATTGDSSSPEVASGKTGGLGEPLGHLLRLGDGLKSWVGSLLFRRYLSQPIVRPVDLVRASLDSDPGANFDVVGYYPGDMANTCSYSDGQADTSADAASAPQTAPAR